jgi:hypothetical protein
MTLRELAEAIRKLPVELQDMPAVYLEPWDEPRLLPIELATAAEPIKDGNTQVSVGQPILR